MAIVRPLVGGVANWRGVLRRYSTVEAFMSSLMASGEGGMPVVGHDKLKKEFYIRMERESTEKAILQYDMYRKGYVDFYHTFVPEVYRGKGLAKHLAKAALDYAVEEDLKMKLTCTYLQKYAKDNPLPQYQERIVPT
ncbi:protein NATD1-like [Branchiostoma floridae]|uniref:Protein NATD1 n=2 Tax=Branchiostoma floridae TaxID=7739 RepID=A0A9J7KU77_BRAFL|nr:protein NATD1-like [Branchiostoma floridae]